MTSKDIECPYCGEWQEIDHDDGYGYTEDEYYQQECADCDKEFAYTTYIIFGYTANKADCLNGSKHPYKPSSTCPPECTSMYCPDCGGTRPSTPEEMQDVLEKTQ